MTNEPYVSIGKHKRWPFWWLTIHDSVFADQTSLYIFWILTEKWLSICWKASNAINVQKIGFIMKIQKVLVVSPYWNHTIWIFCPEMTRHDVSRYTQNQFCLTDVAVYGAVVCIPISRENEFSHWQVSTLVWPNKSVLLVSYLWLRG